MLLLPWPSWRCWYTISAANACFIGYQHLDEGIIILSTKDKSPLPTRWVNPGAGDHPKTDVDSLRTSFRRFKALVSLCKSQAVFCDWERIWWEWKHGEILYHALQAAWARKRYWSL
jgi:hypothetical protein